jgi:hypothetical protein
MNLLIQQKKAAPVFLVALACFGLLPTMRAVSPPPDGGYPGGNTAEGQNALLSLTSGTYNTAVGFFSLSVDSTGSFNTASGAGALLSNTADKNTAIGAGALLSNTTGCCNTAHGVFALLSNTTGDANTAVGEGALQANVDGSNNTAIGERALFLHPTGSFNTAVGRGTLIGSTGSLNTALGWQAGANQTGGQGNVYIGAGISGVAGEQNTTYIRNVYGSQATARIVYVNSDNKIGTLSSSRRYKEDIKPMDKASEELFALRPVTFRYKKEIDRARALSFGLIAEEVAKISPDLITRDSDGKPETVRYDAVNVMLLNEFLKEHRKNEEQQKQINVLTAQLNEQAAQIQKVSAQLEASKPAPQMVLNDQ